MGKHARHAKVKGSLKMVPARYVWNAEQQQAAVKTSNFLLLFAYYISETVNLTPHGTKYKERRVCKNEYT